jgi:hypothetical protein
MNYSFVAVRNSLDIIARELKSSQQKMKTPASRAA